MASLSRLHRSLIACAALLLVAGACGTRVGSASAPVASAVPGPAQPGLATPSSDEATPAVTVPVGTPGVAGGSPASGRTAPAVTAPAGIPGHPAADRSGAGPGAAASSAGTNAGQSPARSGVSPDSVPAVPNPGRPSPGGPADTGPKSPLVLASVGTYSGPVGATLGAILNGAQIWVRSINARGGLNGHPIQLIVFDDGGDPARHRAEVQAAVEQKKAQAFFANAEVFTGESSVEYVNEKRIPIIGTDNGEAWAYRSPMHFVQGPSGNYLVYTMIATAAEVQVPLGKTKLGMLVCAEVVSCNKADEIRAAHAKRLGFDTVYSGKASIAQPDFTAECLAARNAGTQTFLVIMDANSLGRVAAACARQGFHPTYVNVAGNMAEDLAKNPDFEGLLGNSTVAPFFQTGTAGTDEFQRAIQAYGQHSLMGVGLITGWVAGKLLERAGANLPEPPTTEALLKGLWSIKSDNLGGLSAQALTFAENQPPVGVACWYALQVKQGHWTSPDGFRANCDSTHID